MSEKRDATPDYEKPAIVLIGSLTGLTGDKNVSNVDQINGAIPNGFSSGIN